MGPKFKAARRRSRWRSLTIEAFGGYTEARTLHAALNLVPPCSLRVRPLRSGCFVSPSGRLKVLTKILRSSRNSNRPSSSFAWWAPFAPTGAKGARGDCSRFPRPLLRWDLVWIVVFEAKFEFWYFFYFLNFL
jgi:hypothetical protein